MPQQKLTNAHTAVMQQLPQEVLAALTAFWDSTTRSRSQVDGDSQYPRFVLVKGLIETMFTEQGTAMCHYLHPSAAAFDYDFVDEAPIEVVQSLIAAWLADSYFKITDSARYPWKTAVPAETVRGLLAEWGFRYDEPEIYLAAKETTAVDKLAKFYAFRYAHYNQLPPAAADTAAVITSLKDMKCGHLEVNLRSEMRNSVRVFDLVTKRLTEIPRSELAPGYVLARIEGIEGAAYVNARNISLSDEELHGGLSEEFKRVIRHCMKLEGGIDPATYEQHVHLFLCDLNPQRDLMTYFHRALVYAHFSAKKVISSTKRRRLWRWIVHCSMTEPSTAMETWEWESEDRDLFLRIANFYYSCDYEAEFKTLFDIEKVFCLPLNSTKEK